MDIQSNPKNPNPYPVQLDISIGYPITDCPLRTLMIGLAILLDRLGKYTEATAIRRQASSKPVYNTPLIERTEDQHGTAGRNKRKAEHEGNRDPRRSTRIKQSRTRS